QAFELDQHVLAEGIDRLAFAVERQHQDAVFALLGFPVAEAQSVEACNHATPSVRVRGTPYHPEVVRPASNPGAGRRKAARGAGLSEPCVAPKCIGTGKATTRPHKEP